MKRAVGIFFAFSFLFASYSFAATDEVTVTARAFPDKFTIGGEIHFLIQVERPKKFSVEPPSRKVDLAPFEIKFIDPFPTLRGKNRIRETFTLTLTAFQLGDLTIPPFPIRVRNDSGHFDTVLTDPVHVKVGSVGKKKTDKDDIRPIKGPVSMNLSAFRAWVMGILAVLLAVLLAAKIILRRRKGSLADPESLKPPHERASIELERLKAKGLLEEKKAKEFYSELSDILRRYLERRFAVTALDCTTRELILELKQKDFMSGLISKTKEVLENADLVKFAKYDPPRSMAEVTERRILEIVEDTKPPEEEKDKKK